eukprot:TRINITY_DN642_c0_g1_i9.p1 TRINITY_DN642_c0_g1~~TRINITY_DN642_c0_g1_i9.p1  ORF type:complete len:222 (-),score=27.16 TRINITY_DN642_c0_g1_i9:226-891(-)
MSSISNTVSILNKLRVVLASTSPRRRELLALAGLKFDCVAPNYEETIEEHKRHHTTGPDEARIHAIGKAKEVYERLQQQDGDNAPSIVIGSDTVVIKDLNDTTVYGKPKSHEEAIATLMQWSGSSHYVVSAVCIYSKHGPVVFSNETRVEFTHFSPEDAAAYVATGEPMDKAGSYAVQGRGGAMFVKGIYGCYYNVVGLPVQALLEALNDLVAKHPDISAE